MPTRINTDPQTAHRKITSWQTGTGKSGLGGLAVLHSQWKKRRVQDFAPARLCSSISTSIGSYGDIGRRIGDRPVIGYLIPGPAPVIPAPRPVRRGAGKGAAGGRTTGDEPVLIHLEV